MNIYMKILLLYIMKNFFSFSLYFGILIASTLTLGFSFEMVNNAYGDGLFMEQLSASLGDRTADLLIKMSPPVVTTQTIQDQSQKPVIQFKLFDAKTNQTFKEVTYFITIEKDGKTLLSDWFFNPEGDLLLQMQPRNQSHISVYGELDPILNAYSSRGSTPVVAAGPIFLEGGLYHFTVRIVTVDFSRTIIPDDQQPVFDGWLSVGAAKDANLDVNGEVTPIKVLSYYDEIGNITYDQSKNSINFTMPFNYNLDRLNDPKNNVYIHQEVEIPRPSPLSASGGYLGYTNHKDVSNVLMVDGSNKTKDVVHFMMTKPVVLQIASEYVKNTSNNNTASDNDSLMTFSLIPSRNGSMPMGGSGTMAMHMNMNMNMNNTNQ
jgi:hypothetical protein